VRWFPRTGLSRVFGLHTEIEIFLRERKYPLSKQLRKKKFAGTLAYITDIFARLHINQLNVKYKGSVTVIDARNKIQTFQTKLGLWSRRVQKRNRENFQRWPIEK